MSSNAARPVGRNRNTLSVWGLALVLSVALVAGPGCNPGPEKEAPEEVTRDLSLAEQQLSLAANNFGFHVFREVSAGSEDENVFISPLSISFALGMAYNGAAGTTEAGMRQVLGYDALELAEVNEAYRGLIDLLEGLDPKVQLEIANSVWYREGFGVEAGFLERNETYFDAQVQSLDFSAADAAQTINDWVDAATHGRIPEIVDDPISADLVMFLINAVYFKGTWTLQFDPEDTSQASFTRAGGSQVTVPMMRLEGDLFAFENDELQAVDLAYGDGHYRMAVVLPRPGVSLDAVIAGLDAPTWATWMAQLTEQEANLSMPRFEMTFETSLADTLKQLGMDAAFNPGEADFSGINPMAELYISDVKHKTFLKVDEEGTEAAAVTSVEVGVTSVPQIFTMVVDRPFLIVIHDTHSQSMLFMGRVGNPT